MNRRAGRATFFFAALAFFGLFRVAAADDPYNCLLCHQYRGLGRIEDDGVRLHLYFVDPDYGHDSKGPHARLACTDCHERAEVAVVPHEPVTRVDCAKTCHLSDPTGLERIFSHQSAADMLEQSVHTSEAFEKMRFTGGPLLDEGQSRCLYCHDEPLFRDPGGAIPVMTAANEHVFDRCDTCHRENVAVDIAYYVKHVASRFQPARSTVDMAQICAFCHSDPAILADFEMSDAVASYVRSFHGKAALLGDTKTASCVSCHVMAGENAHLMLGSENPLSAVHADHVADSCRSLACHPGADLQIAHSAVHLDITALGGTLEYVLVVFFIVATILTFGPSALLVLLDLFHVVLGRGREDHHAAAYRVKALMGTPKGRQRLIRFTVEQRVEHWLLAVLFTVLVLTGFPLKFADREWASALIGFFGGLDRARFVHHWSGLLLVLGFTAHLVKVGVGYWLKWRREDPSRSIAGAWKTLNSLPMWITGEDVRKSRQLAMYLLFLRKQRPAFGRFSPTEKFEYLGVFWGTVLLGVTGVLLWTVQSSSHLVSGRAFNLASIAHTYEAFLAMIHVGILHIYNVIFSPKVFPLSKATLTGETPADKLAEEHGELVDAAARDVGMLDSED